MEINRKVTVEYLDLGLRMVGITIDKRSIAKIIALVELIEKKGGETDVKDVCELMEMWKHTELNQTIKTEQK